MRPSKALPIDPSFANVEDYCTSLLAFVTSNRLFQLICGGIHVLDFLTQQPDLYSTALPQEWRDWFDLHEIDSILHLLLREDRQVIEDFLHSKRSDGVEDDCEKLSWREKPVPPQSLIEYVIAVRRHALRRNFVSHVSAKDKIRGQLAVGMTPKKIHEVENLAPYLNRLNAYAAGDSPHHISHLVDFGSGQNYLGRTLASSPFEMQVEALESKPDNISGARAMDIHAKLAPREKHVRDKSRYDENMIDKGAGSMVSETCPPEAHVATHEVSNRLHYHEFRIMDSNLSDIIGTIQSASGRNPQLMTVSLHSCGNLIHHGLRSIVTNDQVKAVAMVGCCYNLVTSRLGPPTSKVASLRSTNLRLDQTSAAFDSNGFPMSRALVEYSGPDGHGIHLNITARMMACQAPENWTHQDCQRFFTRHFYRSLLQRLLLDQGLVEAPVPHARSENGDANAGAEALDPVNIGSLRKQCYTSFLAYVRGAAQKMATAEGRQPAIAKDLAVLTDTQIEKYEVQYAKDKKNLSIMWTLMAFSATLVEAVMLVDRWKFLAEQECIKECWVEPVFEYSKSPRNLIVVGIRR